MRQNSTAPATVQVLHLTKRYGTHTALSDVSFHLEAGHIYGLLGPNGAGKSTTMNLMTGFLTPTEGSVTVCGFDMGEQPGDAKRCIGYLPELPPLYIDQTVEEQLQFAADLKSVSRDREPRTAELERVITAAQLTEVRTRLIRHLSKGYRQRVGIAQALIGDPPVILLDEPTVGLDPQQIIETRQLLTALKETHIVILSSHILSEVSAVCDHVLILSGGRLEADEPLEKLQESGIGQHKLTVTMDGSVDPELLQMTIRKLSGVREVHAEELSLEEVYLQLIQEEKA